MRATPMIRVFLVARVLWALSSQGAAPGVSSPGDQHWAFRPVRHTAPPRVHGQDWAASPIDAYVLSRLENAGLAPSPEASRHALIRRAYYDLTGLPPSFEEIQEFERDTRPDAFARVVDRLLGSPAYGERWGRHWLDVARYADTKDLVLLYGSARIRPYAYTYRDYVIRALNLDTPYDRFAQEQLAADRIDPPVAPWRLAALGFLTLGRLFDNNLPDVYDDQIDTTTRGFLGLTVSCARCHDHKYDAIPQKDYYSLYGVFASSERPWDLPLITDPTKIPGGPEFERELSTKRRELLDHVEAQRRLLASTARKRVGDYLMKVAAEKPDPLETVVFFLSLSPEDLRPQFIARWRHHLEREALPQDPVLGLWHDLLELKDNEFEGGAGQIIRDWLGKERGVASGQINPLIATALAATPPANRAGVARLYGNLLADLSETALGDSPEPDLETLPPAQRQLLSLMAGRESPIHFPESNTYIYMSRVDRDKYGKLVQELDQMAVQSTNAPPRAMVLLDSAIPYDPHVFVRGNPRIQGAPVDRQFLEVLSGPSRRPFSQGSGRLELAQAMSAPDNPLFARVIANRIWMHHFGEPLVSTPNDFGLRSNPPSHPDLLDYLAASLQQNGWSLKTMHREIMLSNVYQQASRDRPDCGTTDPDNRLLWRANRRRLDFESMRDTLLAVSGRLSGTLGGRAQDVAGDPLNTRRTVYGLVDRQDLPGVYRAFDFASPDGSAERRATTTTPQQALFAMNSPFVIEQARGLAKRSMAGNTTPSIAVRSFYRLALGRDPSAAETEAALGFVDAVVADPESAGAGLGAWEQLAQVLLGSNELFFLD
ncbi:MAG: DUF1549 and DUF1553 domain-containing protein [Verrucomicrobia bacterium]|nr:DUF1549 and DUF1553 domain-containing protein [Verrucomicrobiota bacterium]